MWTAAADNMGAALVLLPTVSAAAVRISTLLFETEKGF